MVQNELTVLGRQLVAVYWPSIEISKATVTVREVKACACDPIMAVDWLSILGRLLIAMSGRVLAFGFQP